MIDASTSNADKRVKIFNSVNTGTLAISRWDLKNRIGSGIFLVTVRETQQGNRFH
jgi:hypothetical protein